MVVFVTVGSGLFGAGIAWALGLAAPFLTGPALAVAFVSLMGVKCHIPLYFRNAVFLIIGIVLGSGVTPDILREALTWPISIILTCVSVSLIMLCSVFVLECYFHMDRTTSILASSPGHLSFILSLGSEITENISSIAVIQSIRVFILTLAVPIILSLSADGELTVNQIIVSKISLTHFFFIAAPAIFGAFLMSYLKLPAAFLLSGLLLSSIGHGLGVTPGELPKPISLFCFIVLGSLIGSRFSGVSFALLRSLALSGFLITLIGLVISIIISFLIHLLTGINFLYIIIALAPGGFETMVAMSAFVGADPAYVAIHHIARIFFLSALVPLALTLKLSR
jgi:hypothetical protein